MAIDSGFDDGFLEPVVEKTPEERFWIALKNADDFDAADWGAEGIDLNIRNSDGDPATIVALRGERFDAVKSLIQNGADVNLTGKPQTTLLMRTAVNGYPSLCKWLLDNTDININAQDKDGDTALTEAIYNKNLKVFNILMDYNADPYVLNYKHKNAWDWAKQTEDPYVIGIVRDRVHPTHGSFIKTGHHSVELCEKTPSGAILSHVFNFQSQTMTSLTSVQGDIHDSTTTNFRNVPRRTLSEAQNALKILNTPNVPTKRRQTVRAKSK